jgi:hypothetical protein
MIHIAPRAFYDEISARLSDCDVILFEGVRSQTVSRLTTVYRQAAKNRRLGFVVQSHMQRDHLADTLVHADLDAAEFERRWRELPWVQRWLMPLLSLAMGLALRFFGTRERIAARLDMDLLPSRQDVLGDHEARQVILDSRDAHLLEAIDAQLSARHGTVCTIGVLYGAGHMRAVIRHLTDAHGFSVGSGEWVVVFDL